MLCFSWTLVALLIKKYRISVCVYAHAHMSLQSLRYTIAVTDLTQNIYIKFTVSASLHTSFKHSTLGMMMTQCVLQDLSWLETLLSKCQTECLTIL